jgi:hypothetical protein
MTDVFLSYSQRSQAEAALLRRELEKVGLSTWYAPEVLEVGEPWKERIFQGIREARVLVFLLDTNAAVSPYVEHEYMAALEHSWSDPHKILLPVLIGDAEAPAFLRHRQALKVRDRKGDWARTAKEIAKLLRGEHSVKPSKAPIKEQMERLNLIEREANALRDTGTEQSHKR